MQILVETRHPSLPTVEKSGGLFDVSLTELLGFEQVPCYEDDHGISDQKFLSFVSSYNIKDYENAVSMVYEQYSGSNCEMECDSGFGLNDTSSFGSQSDSEGNLSESEDDFTSSSFNSSSGGVLYNRNRRSSSLSSVGTASEMQTVTRWYGVYVPSENALYLESPSTSTLRSDCLTDILDVAECMNCFKVYIGIPRNRLDIIKQYLFAGFEISKKGQIVKPTPASIHGGTPITDASGSNHILLEYEL